MRPTVTRTLIDDLFIDATDSDTDILDALRSAEGQFDAARCGRLFAGGLAEARHGFERALERLNATLTAPERRSLANRLADQMLSLPVELTGADAVALLLAAGGVEQVFAYPGTSELALCDAVDDLPGIQLVNSRGDKEGSFMAAGASMLRPTVGAAILHGARGLTNAGGGLADARRNEFGTVYIVGLPSTGSMRFLPPHGEFGLIDAMGNFARRSWEAPPVPNQPEERSHAAATFVRQLRTALAVAATQPAGPVLFGLPQDLAETSWLPLSALAAVTAPEDVPDGAVDPAVLALLRASRRPVILIDDYALRSPELRPALDRFSQRIGAAVLQLRYRRGPMLFERLQTDEVANFVGWLDQYSAAHRAILDDCDLMITVEDRNIYRRVVGDLPACRKMAINTDPAKALKNEYLDDNDHLVEGNPATILSALTDRLDVVAPGDGMSPAWFLSHVRKDSRITPEPPSKQVLFGRKQVSAAVSDLLGSWLRPVLIDDSQMFGGLLAEHYDDLPRGLRVFGSHGGFVGCGLAYATGLAIAEPDVRVLCTLGDQAFTNSFQALVTAVEQRARLVIIVCNNGESVSLKKQGRASYGAAPRRYLANVSDFSYHGLAKGIGMAAELVKVPVGAPSDVVSEASAAFREALRRAAAVNGPALVELVLPAEAEAWRGIWLANGFEQIAPVRIG